VAAASDRTARLATKGAKQRRSTGRGGLVTVEYFEVKCVEGYFFVSGEKFGHGVS
jgi:hypothetical protein